MSPRCRRSITRSLMIAGLATMTSFSAHAAAIQVAVASNFTNTIEDIAARYETQSERGVELAFGSTGKLYAQIVNGAPFDAFFAADVERPQRLEQEGHIVDGSRFTYARGQIVLWSPDAEAFNDPRAVLEAADFEHIAIANPRLAPYGRAAQQTLEALGEWQALQPKIVTGQNIGQTYQFTDSGNAELGFVALSQIQRPGTRIEGSHWIPPAGLYEPIYQQAVVIRDSPAVRDFMAFVRGDEAAGIIRDYGYALPARQ